MWAFKKGFAIAAETREYVENEMENHVKEEADEERKCWIRQSWYKTKIEPSSAHININI